MSESGQFGLLKQRRFGPFFITQFLGAFNDNLFKNALIILIAFEVADSGGLESGALINLSAALFILPFFLFSATAGQLADKYEKSGVIRSIKLAEIVIMSIAAAGLLTGNLMLLILLLFMMGGQSAFFGPVKYGILPQHLRDEELVGGNGLVEMGTFLAILLGTMAGGILIAAPHGKELVAGIVLGIALAGYWASRRIPMAAAVDPKLAINWNPATETVRILRFAQGNRTVFLSILGISWFWLFGAIILAQLPNYTRFTLGGNQQVITLLLTLFSAGIGVGSLLCERLSGRRVELGLVPFGSIGMTLFMLDLFFARPGADASSLDGALAFLAASGNWRVLVDILMIGVFGGFFIVPLYALIQQRSEATHRSRIIAGNSILNALFMVIASVFAIGLLSVGLNIPQLFLVVGLMNAAVAIYIYSLVPEFLMRFIVWMIVNTMYRVRTEGLRNIPDEGPVLLICNHVSFMDALIIAGCCRRPVRFVMDHGIFKIPILSFVFRTAKAIPIAPYKVNPELLTRAYDTVAAELENGQVVCLFPEGRITRDGEVNEFRSGVERITKRTPVPVVPMALQGMWGSFFSRKHGAAMKHFPRRVWSRIALVAGELIPAERVSAPLLREQVLELRGEHH